MREGVANCGSKLEEDEGHVKDALEGVAGEPESERRGGTLGERGEEDGGGDRHEGEVPDHVEHEHRPRVGAVGDGDVGVVVVGSAVGAVGEEEAAAVGGDEAGEGDGAQRGAAENGISSSGGGDVAVLLVHVRERKGRERKCGFYKEKLEIKE